MNPTATESTGLPHEDAARSDHDAAAPNVAWRARLVRSDTVRSVGIQVLGIGTFYLAIVLYFWLSAPVFGTTSNFRNIIDNSVVTGIVALGQTIVLIAGGFDLSVSGVVPLAGVAFAMLGNDGVPI